MKIIVAGNIPFGKEALSTLGDVEIREGREITPKRVKDAFALIVRSTTKVNSKLLEGSRVKFVGTTTIGFDHIDIDYLKKGNIHFASAPGSNSNSVSEYVICSLLFVANKLNLKLKDLPLGIIGIGNIGSKVEKKAHALGMNVLLNDPPLFDLTGDEKYRPIDELMDNCDVLTYHVPLTREGKYPTYHMINNNFLNNVRKNPIIINTSRGSIADTNALKNALLSGNISKVIIDVWENEPKIDIESLKMSLVGTSHIAGHSLDGKVNGTYMIYQSLCKYLGKKKEWNPEYFLPEPICPIIEFDKESGSLEERLYRIVKQVYDIKKDDLNLKKSIDMPFEERGEYFDSLRKNYPIRREFFNTEVHLKEENLELENMLRKIGFKIQKT